MVGPRAASPDGAIERIAHQLEVQPEALRTQVWPADVGDGYATATTTADAQRILQR